MLVVGESALHLLHDFIYLFLSSVLLGCQDSCSSGCQVTVFDSVLEPQAISRNVKPTVASKF